MSGCKSRACLIKKIPTKKTFSETKTGKLSKIRRNQETECVSGNRENSLYKRAKQDLKKHTTTSIFFKTRKTTKNVKKADLCDDELKMINL